MVIVQELDKLLKKNVRHVTVQVKFVNVKINVKIPAGIDNGQQIRVSGKGEAGVNGGPAGDLYVVVHVEIMNSSSVKEIALFAKCH